MRIMIFSRVNRNEYYLTLKFADYTSLSISYKLYKHVFLKVETSLQRVDSGFVVKNRT